MTETLILTPQMAAAAFDHELSQRLAARKLLRPQRQASAMRGVRNRGLRT